MGKSVRECFVITESTSTLARSTCGCLPAVDERTWALVTTYEIFFQKGVFAVLAQEPVTKSGQ
ncbi:uncharacterized protein SEPMUDRAFT_123564 [Sphaerulina musiva SO2202]|uniref:Uncharacterized protein n=1 Tax=Sphaerulina musiva (strain SO2202) TaxID=692275 RepID=M3DBJ1_SPHMS|nr:uncharacterized protein SEPMUDRAFT_123564 [Sphaerulina musiva SO2202]EMF15229.1 hypothetical protein SEPMUDRAFT_123564 [Sphaerulina musiva SO2202]